MNATTVPIRGLARCRPWLLTRLDQGREGWPMELRERARALDQHLVGRAGLGMGLGLLGGAFGLVTGLRSSGASWGWALLIAGLYTAGLVALGLRAWREPEVFGTQRLRRVAWLMVLATYASTLTLTVQRTRGGGPGWPAASEWPALLWAATPIQLLLALSAVLIVWLMSSARRQVLQAELQRAALVRERDAAARAAAEARLALLQAQIQPHFIFNTLAALQHWVDTGDARAPGLLRDLTGFLRASTEQMLQEQVTLAQEGAMLAQYLAIQQARLGQRLRCQLDLPASLQHQTLPSGLLLTLVENALEHGVGPALQGGEVRVSAAAGQGGVWLRVDNSGQPLAAPPLPGVGWRNCLERLQRLKGPQASLQLRRLTDGRTRAEVWWPGSAA
jgi:uncharacterized membrane protein YhaH (DUF805 family)